MHSLHPMTTNVFTRPSLINSNITSKAFSCSLLISTIHFVPWQRVYWRELLSYTNVLLVYALLSPCKYFMLVLDNYWLSSTAVT